MEKQKRLGTADTVGMVFDFKFFLACCVRETVLRSFANKALILLVFLCVLNFLLIFLCVFVNIHMDQTHKIHFVQQFYAHGTKSLMSLNNVLLKHHKYVRNSDKFGRLRFEMYYAGALRQQHSVYHNAPQHFPCIFIYLF